MENTRAFDHTDRNRTIDMSEAMGRSSNVPYLVVLAGESVGRVIRLAPNQELRIGRSRNCEVVFDCDNISREHAKLELDAEGNATLLDAKSTNGTLVNGKRVKTAALHDGDRICMGNIILRFSFQDDLEFDLHRNLYDKATRDPLTGAHNKRHLLETLDREFAFHKRQDMPLTLVILDLDNFKKINDTYGHVNGDIVLKSLAREVMSCLRKEDEFTRFGGEEFVALFRCTPRETALVIANKLLELIRSMRFSTATAEFGVTATIGLATLEGENYEASDDLIMAADRNLYAGKRQGKNVVIG